MIFFWKKNIQRLKELKNLLIDDDDDHPSDGFMDTWFNLLNEEDFNENNEDEESDLEEDSEDLKLLLHRRVHPILEVEIKIQKSKYFDFGSMVEIKSRNDFG